MGISDELRDLAATPPEATAMSASLADQAVGFAIKARRVARMKIAAAVTAGAIATTGVAIGVVTSNDNSDLPVSTPVVTITPSSASPSQSSSASPSSSPTQSESPEQSASPSDAPILVQPSQPELEPAGPGTDPNILEEILETLRSLPERIVEALRGSPEPGTNETPIEEDPNPAPTEASSSAPGLKTPDAPTTGSPSPTPSSSESSPEQTPTTTEPSSASPSVPKWCQMEIVWKRNGVVTGELTYSYSCEKGEELKKALEEDPSLASENQSCTLITKERGKRDDEGTRTAVKCPDLES